MDVVNYGLNVLNNKPAPAVPSVVPDPTPETNTNVMADKSAPSPSSTDLAAEIEKAVHFVRVFSRP